MTFFLFAFLLFADLVASQSTGCGYSCASTRPRTFGTNGLNLVTFFEGFSATCYRDTAGIWTIGFGHACLDASTDLPQFGVRCVAGTCSGTLTQNQARTVLNNDILIAANCVNNAIRRPVTQNQFDALVSFTFNVGCGGFQGSTMLSMLNAGTLTDAAAQFQFTRWHSGCTAGLIRRRFSESQLFSSNWASPCTTGFNCNFGATCPSSTQWNQCRANCQYCTACGGCTSDALTMGTCLNRVKLDPDFMNFTEGEFDSAEPESWPHEE